MYHGSNKVKAKVRPPRSVIYCLRACVSSFDRSSSLLLIRNMASSPTTGDSTKSGYRLKMSGRLVEIRTWVFPIPNCGRKSSTLLPSHQSVAFSRLSITTR